MAELHGQLEDVKGAAATLGYDRDLYRDLLRLFSQEVYGEDLSIDEISRRLDPDGEWLSYSRRWESKYARPTAVTFIVTTQEGEERTLSLPATTPYPRKGETMYVHLPDGPWIAKLVVTDHVWKLTSDADGYGTDVKVEVYLSEVPSA
jgi:hypothetical protein